MSSETPDTRNRILAAAWALLEKHHGRNVRMSDIAREAGVSRQAVYLHFENRTDLLIETTRYIDREKNVDERLAASRAAPTGRARLDAFIEAWGGYIPEIYGVARALMAAEDGAGDADEAASAAWANRMDAMREGCAAAVAALARDGDLTESFDAEAATDLLWTLLSVRNWESLTQARGWSQERYIGAMKHQARAVLLRP